MITKEGCGYYGKRMGFRMERQVESIIGKRENEKLGAKKLYLKK